MAARKNYFFAAYYFRGWAQNVFFAEFWFSKFLDLTAKPRNFHAIKYEIDESLSFSWGFFVDFALSQIDDKAPRLFNDPFSKNWVKSNILREEINAKEKRIDSRFSRNNSSANRSMLFRAARVLFDYFIEKR